MGELTARRFSGLDLGDTKAATIRGWWNIQFPNWRGLMQQPFANPDPRAAIYNETALAEFAVARSKMDDHAPTEFLEKQQR